MLALLVVMPARVWAQATSQAPAPATQTHTAPAGGPHDHAHPAGSADDLSVKATDPTASLMSINFLHDVRTSYHGVNDTGFEFRLQPVTPFRAWGRANIFRVVVPYQVDGPGEEGLKSVSMFDLMVFPTKWGRMGFGPIVSFSAAGSGPSTFAIGPALGAVVQVSKRLNVGLFNQNAFGDGVKSTQIQPIIAYQLGNGWAVSAGDLQYVYDIEHGEWVSLPIGVQIGKVHRVVGQAMRFSVNPQWNFAKIIGANRARIVFGVTLIAPS